MNRLIYGDNLTIMQEVIPKESIDLIYLDPPFNSNRNYNLMYRNLTGQPIPEQVDAFCDTWTMDEHKEALAKNIPIILHENGIDAAYMDMWRFWINALRKVNEPLLAYLIYMTPRLCSMKSLLKKTGSIYLHCDPTASHYIKCMMDGIFGQDNFRNEIVWKRRTGSSSAVHKPNRFGSVTDTILYYTMSDKHIFNPQYSFSDPRYKKYIEEKFVYKDDNGRLYRNDNLTNPIYSQTLIYEYKGFKPPEKGWAISKEKMEKWDKEGRLSFPTKPDGRIQRRRYLDELKGKPIQSLWDDIAPVNSQAKDRLGYPTQKPIDLLKRIILTSTNEGDTVFDPFCGCGTTIYAAQATKRNWIGCDIAILAVNLVSKTLQERYKLADGHSFKIEGIPNSMESAQHLADHDKYQFQNWIVERIGGFPTLKKAGDKGVDGRLYFETKNGLKEMVLSVKAGKIQPTDIRDLRGVLEREANAEMAGFLCMQEPTKAMIQEGASAGLYEYAGNQYPRLQILTARQILEDKQLFKTPTRIGTKVDLKQYLLPMKSD